MMILVLLGASETHAWLAPTRPTNLQSSFWSNCLGTACLGATLALGDPSFALETRDVPMNAQYLMKNANDSRETVSTTVLHPQWNIAVARSSSSSLHTWTTLGDNMSEKAHDLQQMMSHTVSTTPQYDSFLLYHQSTLMLAAENDDSVWQRRPPIPSLMTNENVVGGVSLGLGIVYGISYAYYQYSTAQEQAQAQRKKEQAMAKKKAAAKKATVMAVKTSIEKEAPVQQVAVMVPAMSREEEIAVERARAAVEQAKRFDLAARMRKQNREVQQVDTVEVVLHEKKEKELKSRRKQSWWKFWRRSKSRVNEDDHQ